jgi:DNA-binding winged helix-turn-helix (wHTH) protein/TolB-like protein
MVYRFGVFEFDDAANELHRQGRVVALEPQPARALARLLAGAGDIVDRDALKTAVWGNDTHVDFDRGLAYCLSQIRAALGDSGENPRFVQTVPRHGYKFIAPVQTDASSTSAASSTSGASTVPPPVSVMRRVVVTALLLVILAATAGWLLMLTRVATDSRTVIAVSIFDNETGDPQFDRLVAGMSDLVVTRLTEIDPTRISVIGNAAVLRQPRNIRNLKAVAEGVKADYVLLGQLQRDETGYRFITHFIRLSDETHLKANRIAMPDGNVTGLEQKVVDEFDRAVRLYVLNRIAN